MVFVASLREDVGVDKVRRRAARMSRLAPVPAAISSNRRCPRTISRSTNSDHFSPTTSKALAMEQLRPFVAVISGPLLVGNVSWEFQLST